MNELRTLVPGLWIGSLASVRNVVSDGFENIKDNNNKPGDDENIKEDQQVHWTIITILDNEKLIRLAKAILMSVGANSRVTSFITEEKLLWRLADRCNAPLVSESLSILLERMDKALLKPQNEQQFCTTTLKEQQDRTTTIRSCCLVHCAQGISRSAAVCAAWYMTRRNKSLQEALHAIRQSRPEIQPNLGFLADLKAIEQCHGDIDKAMERLQRGGN